jgi:hypothetical protein
MCRSCATLVYREASCACRGTHTLSTSVPNVLQKHPNRPPKQSSRIRSAPTALHQGSEMLFQNQTTLCVNVSPTLRFRRISGWDLHSTAISLRSHCDLTAISLSFSDTVSSYRTPGAFPWRDFRYMLARLTRCGLLRFCLALRQARCGYCPIGVQYAQL